MENRLCNMCNKEAIIYDIGGEDCFCSSDCRENFIESMEEMEVFMQLCLDR